jgi:probable F420-dependent oxidoreductase
LVHGTDVSATQTRNRTVALLSFNMSFGIVLRGSPSAAAFGDVVARAEALGCDVVAAPDHLGAPDPFATLTAAAQISASMRLRTYVLNVGFWNPALLARAAATTDVLSDGRLELGLGAGHMRREHEDAKLHWHGHRARVEQLEATLTEVCSRLSDADHRPRPVQGRIPIAVGAMTPRGLRVAAEHADIVAFSGLVQVPGAPAGTLTIASAAETERRVAEVREMARSRDYRSDALIQAIAIGEEPHDSAARLAAEFGSISAEQILDTPFVLLARDRAHAAEVIAERRERFGFDSFMTHEPHLGALGEVIAACSG